MPRADYNSDKERHAEHKWEVIRATRRDLPGIDVDGKEMKFAKKGDVTVTRIRYPGAADRGHRYFFGGWPLAPWKENGNGEAETQEEEGLSPDAGRIVNGERGYADEYAQEEN